MPKITASSKGSKPAKPSRDFPLFPHQNGQWAKKIAGQLVYFGTWEETDKALTRWYAFRDAKIAGRPYRDPYIDATDPDAPLTVRDLCNKFLNSKRAARDDGELSPRTFADYFTTCKRIVDTFGKDTSVATLGPSEFEWYRRALAKKFGPVAIGNEVNRVRSIFKYADSQDLLSKPVKFGDQFKRPSQKQIRLERASKPKRMFEPAELRKLIDAAPTTMKAMVLLGVNCGLGNTDCSEMEFRHLDLRRGWLDYPRPKTGVDRKAKLWPETMAAIERAIGERKAPKETADKDRVFLTQTGRRWIKVNMRQVEKGEDQDAVKREVSGTPADALSQEFTKLIREIKIHRPGLGFYTLRHVFETVAGGTRDQVAVDFAMGHSDPSMAAKYREEIGDERLEDIADHVHQWLYAELKKNGGETATTSKPAKARAKNVKANASGNVKAGPATALKLFVG